MSANSNAFYSANYSGLNEPLQRPLTSLIAVSVVASDRVDRAATAGLVLGLEVGLAVRPLSIIRFLNFWRPRSESHLRQNL